MENLVLLINVILAIVLVGLILLQKSEGGALGLGVSQDSFISSRSAGNFLTKVTTVIATIFMITSLGLGVMSSNDKSRSIMPDEVVTTPANSSEASPVDVDKKSE